MQTAIYLRKSRSDADDLSIEETLRRHKETLMEFAAKQPNITIYKIYEEVVSGDSLYARPQMLQLLQDAENGLFNAVLCVDIQRLGRGKTSEQGLILETFKAHNIKIITPRKIYDLSNDLDEDYAEFETFMARRELTMIKRRLHAGTIKSVQEGCFMPPAPYGYKKVTVNKRPTLEIYEPEAKFVRMAFDLYANGGLGTQAIAHTLNGLGAVPHRGKQFNRTSIAAMLRNKVYIGKIVWNKKHTENRYVAGEKIKTVYHDKSEWMIFDGLHPALIDDETFDKANALLSSRYHKPYNDGTIVNPLGGILKCSECGYGMQRRPFSANRKYQTDHLLCATKGCCKSSRLDLVENAVIDNIAKKLAELKVASKSAKPTVDYTGILTHIDKELSELQKQKEKLYDLLEKGIYDIDTYLERQNVIGERRKNLENEKSAVLSEQTAQKNKDIDVIIKKFENVLKLYNDSSPSEKNALLKSIVSSGTYYKEKSWKPNQFVITLNYRDI